MSTTTTTGTRTPTRTEPRTGSRLRVERDGGRTVVTELRTCAPVALRVLPDRDACARVAIVQSGAMLVAGDVVELDVAVGPGAALELVEIGATVAHAVRGGQPIRQTLRLSVAGGGRLVAHEQPLVLAAGTRLVRRTEVRLAGGARCAHRDAVVLGRDGEDAGAAVLRTRVTRDGAPVLDDALSTGERGVLRSPAVLGGARCLATAGLWGTAVGDRPGLMRLSACDALVRGIGPDAPSALAMVEAAWEEAIR